MAWKKSAAGVPRSFSSLLKDRSTAVRDLANALRDLILEEVPDADESFYGGKRPMAMYRTSAEVCWLQPLNERCNLYLLRAWELADPEGLLEGTSKRNRHAKIPSLDHLQRFPVREWLRESVQLNAVALADGITFDELLERLREFCLRLPQTRETLTWGKPHFRVGEKIFCGCGEQHGRHSLRLKSDPGETRMLLQIPGIEKAPYSRPNDGWIQIDPNLFDDWDEINAFIVGSFRQIAPKRVVALLDTQA